MKKRNVLARRPAVLFLPVIAAISPAAAPANAALSTPAVEAGGPVPAASAGAAVAPLQPSNYIGNETSIGIGVSKDYVAGAYQAVLPAHWRTDGSPLYWSRVLSFYVGAGAHCVGAWFYEAGAWHPYATVKGPWGTSSRRRSANPSRDGAPRNHRRC
ncbi:hypothetical protein ACFFSW_35135 [Saccharothrix longispora]|uniref:Secreted protein n=1 Tax=Saccharothrix longispora TaxID=33920 RepID=A0ABU1PRY0_9PSEU|nr:hypothetical protein [Saccharothrix longispora]MDR6593405.1 hypothetical protein [Saccharothrix longispora]